MEPIFSQAPFDERNDEGLIEKDKQELESIYKSLREAKGLIRSKCDTCGETRNDCFVDIQNLRCKCSVCRTFEIFKQRFGREPY